MSWRDHKGLAISSGCGTTIKVSNRQLLEAACRSLLSAMLMSGLGLADDWSLEPGGRASEKLGFDQRGRRRLAKINFLSSKFFDSTSLDIMHSQIGYAVGNEMLREE